MTMKKSKINPMKCISAGAWLLALCLFPFIRVAGQEQLAPRPQQGHTHLVTKIALDPKHRFLVSGDIAGEIRFWDYQTGVLVKTMRPGGAITDIQIDPGLMKMVTYDDDLHLALLWDLNELNFRKLSVPEQTKHVLIRPHTRQALLYTGNSLKFMDLSTEKLTDSLSASIMQLPDISFTDYAMSFSGDGTKLAISISYTSRANGKFEFKHGIALIDCVQKKFIGLLDGTSDICTSVSFSADGRHVAAAGEDYTIKIWDTYTQIVTSTLKTKGIRYHYGSFLSGDSLLVASEDRDENLNNQNKYKMELWAPAFSSKLYDETALIDPYEVWGLSVTTDGRSDIVFPDAQNNIKVVTNGHPVRSKVLGIPFQQILHTDFDPTSGNFLVTQEKKMKVWNLNSQTFHADIPFLKPVKNISFNAMNTAALAFGAGSTGHEYINISKGQTSIVLTAKPEHGVFDMRWDNPGQSALSPDGTLAVLGNSQGQVFLSQPPFTKIVEVLGPFDMGAKQNLVNPMDELAVSADNRYVAFSGYFSDSLKVYDRKLKKYASAYERFGVGALVFSADNKLACLSLIGDIHIYDPANGFSLVKDLPTGFRAPGRAALQFSQNADRIAFGTARGDVLVWNWRTGKQTNEWMVGSTVHSLQFIHQDSLVVASDANAAFHVLSAVNSEDLLTVSFFNDRDWIAYTPQGFFDGTRASWSLIPMSMNSRPWDYFYPEQFFNQFYQPGLIDEIMGHNKSMKAILLERKDERAAADISKYRNSKIPAVTITAGQAFKFHVTNTGSGIRDLKVFHNNMLIYDRTGELPVTGGSFDIAVPIKLTGGNNVISAYCFNDDNIRSREASLTLSNGRASAGPGDVHILAIGINAYRQPSLRLKYAAGDAQTFSEVLGSSLADQHKYRHIFHYPVTDVNATKEKIKGVIQALNDDQPSAATTGLDIHRIGPNDMLFIFYSGHGYASGDNFYLVPQDAAVSTDGKTISNLMSDSELGDLLKTIDCKEIVLIIDACQSGQAIDRPLDKLGPFNSRGLAQLAYEKGMYVIAASQSQQAALEVDTLAHGLLTYTMAIKGLQEQLADGSPKDRQIDIVEWLNYAAQEVPKVYLATTRQKVKLKLIVPGTGKVSYQTPKVYFRRENNYDPLLIKKW